ncbi:F-box protein SKIP8 isoform X2 [Curcuma longa]|uniref:F-box protein SKIP8 isoform X2 n=1 Tax=Curcuma longa TaxID=136217 RepID=UPI003D9F5D3E
MDEATTNWKALQLQTTRSNPFMSTRVVSGDAEGNQSTEEIIVDEQALQRDLESAIEDEDYARAATIRDRLRLLHEDSKAAVFAANARFYRAFRNGDLASMRLIWSKGDHVYVIHPGAGRISGHDMVMGSWEIVCNADYDFPLQIDLKNVEVHVHGDVRYITCMEVVKTKGSSWGKQVATNVFERIDGQWFICIHHASHIDD